MIDKALFNRAARENATVALMALFLIGFGIFLLSLFAAGPAQLSSMPWLVKMHWLDSLTPGFWRGVGAFFVVAGLFALCLGLFCVRQSYRHYLVEHHGIIHSAQVQSADLKEIRIHAGDGIRQVQIGHLRYAYELGGRRYRGSCALGETDIELYRKLKVGDSIPILVLPQKPRHSLLHQGRLNQQYRWSESPPSQAGMSALA